ncbi:MAG: DUF362 domain-containing protein [Candidatus Bathyarchaeia archaeon]
MNSLRLIERRIKEGLEGKRKVLVKPNFVSTRRQLSATHVDAVRAVLDMIGRYHSGKVVIGEGPAGSDLDTGLANYDYFKLQDEYDVDFVDLNKDDYVEVEVKKSETSRIRKFHVSKTVVESDYRVSVALPKTHDMAIVTLTIKNVVVGSLVGHKSRVHQGYRGINLNIAKLAQVVMPHLGVIDGFVGMEGIGPVSGDPVELGAAAASVSPISLDAVMTKIMGFNPYDIGYLYYLDEWKVGTIDLEKIEIAGTPIEEVSRRFRPHPRYRSMLHWKNAQPTSGPLSGILHALGWA